MVETEILTSAAQITAVYQDRLNNGSLGSITSFLSNFKTGMFVNSILELIFYGRISNRLSTKATPSICKEPGRFDIHPQRFSFPKPHSLLSTNSTKFDPNAPLNASFHKKI